jgi:hypothetical protein
MGQRKGTPTPTAQQQAYMDKYGESAARTNSGTTPVMLDDNTNIGDYIDTISKGGFVTDSDLQNTNLDVNLNQIEAATIIAGTTSLGSLTSLSPIYSASDATKQITNADSGYVYIAAKDSATQTFTLPSASLAGLHYTFVCGHAGGEMKIVGPSSDVIKVLTAGASGTSLVVAANTGIKNTAATNVVGDNITLVSDGTQIWYGISQNGIFASN